jgi:hypothetical protein
MAQKEQIFMHDLLPEAEDLRRAVKWVTDSLRDKPGRPVLPLVQEAIFKFDLSPKDAEFLLGVFRQRKEQ